MENAKNNEENTLLDQILSAYEIPKSFFEQQGYGYGKLCGIFDELGKSEKALFSDLTLTLKLKKKAQILDKASGKEYYSFNKVSLNPTLFSSITCDRLKKRLNDLAEKKDVAQYEVVYDCLRILDKDLSQEERFMAKHVGEGISNGDQETILMIVGILFLF